MSTRKLFPFANSYLQISAKVCLVVIFIALSLFFCKKKKKTKQNRFNVSLVKESKYNLSGVKEDEISYVFFNLYLTPSLCNIKWASSCSSNRTSNKTSSEVCSYYTPRPWFFTHQRENASPCLISRQETVVRNTQWKILNTFFLTETEFYSRAQVSTSRLQRTERP